MQTTKSQHTPGPWKIDGEVNNQHRIFSLETGLTVASVGYVHHHGGTDEDEANAALIAAAPELLTFAMHIQRATKEDWERPSFIEALENASRTLVAKAEGRA